MVRAYDTLKLADVYGALSYYLHHQEEVTAYLRRRDEEAAAMQAEIEKERPRTPKDELIARRSATEKANASTGE
jgi:hypothetical protein